MSSTSKNTALNSKRRWTEEENQALLSEYKRQTTVSWVDISIDLFGHHAIDRTYEACRKQWERLQKKALKERTYIGMDFASEDMSDYLRYATYYCKDHSLVSTPTPPKPTVTPWYKKVDWLGILVLVGAIAILTYFVSSL